MLRDVLKNLREDIVLNSLYISDYENRYGLPAKSVCDWFDGYLDFVGEMMEGEIEDYDDAKFFDYLKDYDNIDTLEEWFCCTEGYIGDINVKKIIEDAR